MDKIEKALVVIIFIMMGLAIIGTLALAITRAIGGELKLLIAIPILIAIGCGVFILFREIIKDW